MKINSGWIVGFVDGEGCFHCSINQYSDMLLKYRPLPEFVVVQHCRDIQILYAFKKYFGCGVVRRNHDQRFCYRVRKIEDLADKILPFFEKHKLKTKKGLEFITFRKIVLSMQRKEHLTEAGLHQIENWCHSLRQRKSKIESNSF